MQIKRLVIENFKSIERIELIEPNPFTVFVGPNGSGKSTIFEALEFIRVNMYGSNELIQDLYGGESKIKNRKSKKDRPEYQLEGEGFSIDWFGQSHTLELDLSDPTENPNYLQFSNFSRLFIRNVTIEKLNVQGDRKLTLSAKNLEPVLKRILTNKVIRDEIFEWLELFVPGFKAVEVDDRDELHWFEESIPDYFTKDLISDGTYNILALLTAVYQSEKPQFLCIEEPENGLHPQVLMTLVDLFRQQCEERGHYIWLNTHSASLVKYLTTDEIVLVKKKNGATNIRQIQGRNLYSLPTDDAWLSGALGGGLAW